MTLNTERLINKNVFVYKIYQVGYELSLSVCEGATSLAAWYYLFRGPTSYALFHHHPQIINNYKFVVPGWFV